MRVPFEATYKQVIEGKFIEKFENENVTASSAAQT